MIEFVCWRCAGTDNRQKRDTDKGTPICRYSNRWRWLWLCWPLPHTLTDEDSRELAGSVLFRVAALHGLVLALVFAQELISIRDVHVTSAHEAAMLADIYYDLERYDAEGTQEIRAELERRRRVKLAGSAKPRPVATTFIRTLGSEIRRRASARRTSSRSCRAPRAVSFNVARCRSSGGTRGISRTLARVERNRSFKSFMAPAELPPDVLELLDAVLEAGLGARAEVLELDGHRRGLQLDQPEELDVLADEGVHGHAHG